MTKLLLSTIFILLFLFSQGQDKKEASAYFNLITAIVTTEKLGSNLIYRLDSLKSKFIPSRSNVNDYFNRDIDLGFKHRRITISLNFSGYQVDILCRNDTIFLSSITTLAFKGIKDENVNEKVISEFLKIRNSIYNSAKTKGQLISELSLLEEYAFYCGDGMPKTQMGKYIEDLVDSENATTLIEMIMSFNCEMQAYGVAGMEMLEKRGYEIPYDIQKLIDRIKKRNSEIAICSGCLSGLVEKIYGKK